ncbi:MAG TPA: UDP-3-O-acyl-N-acetylglucosamine deacetylase [Stellaceae bacterium]|jgi:UDP-3-O-acyl-N-acetylglucosamine deacetylase|nr:UDP-3-O-acyl-N-acetylglucosamine deacetylase [Stellaceae bacterium]
MDRTELTRPVIITGPSFLGRDAHCIIAPIAQPGVHLRMPDGEVVPLGAMTLGVNRLLRYLTLTYRDRVLRIPEHLLGLIFALGLDGIVIELAEFRLPYDGRAKIFWDALKAACQPAGTLDWFTPPAPVVVSVAGDRYIELVPAAAGSRQFSFEIEVGYPELGETTLRGIVGAEADHERLASARAYWRTRMRRAVARLARGLGWPHDDIGVWPSSDAADSKARVLEELCWHRLLDMLGMFAALMPPGGRIAGSVVTRRVGHTADIALMHQVKSARLVRV